MFSLNHIIWMIICLLVIITGVICIKKYNPSFNKMVNICFAIGVVSEIIKVFSCVELVPIEGKVGLYPYLETRYLPIHLCSIQIILFAYLKLAKKNTDLKYWIVCLMYPCCVLGGIFAIAIPSIFNTSIKVSEAFTHPLTYQTFLYHAMLIVFGIYLVNNKEIELKKDGYKKSMTLVSMAGFIAIYLNSMFTTPVYENGILKAVSATTNFFFVSQTPIAIPFANKWHWILYILIIAALAFGLVYLLYLPVFKKEKYKD